MSNNTEIPQTEKVILTATFVEIIYLKAKGGRKQISKTITNTKCFFEGLTKKDCLQQAKENFRTGVEWLHEFN